jgi:ribosomal protein L5
MNLTFVTSAKDDKSALKLIKSFGFPFRETSKKEVEESI